MIFIYTWLSEILQKEYEPVRLMKESPRGNIRLIRHRASGRKFVLRRFRGNAGVYRKLLNFSCENLPQIYEVAEKDGKSHPGRICRRRYAGFSPAGYFIHRKETRQIVMQICRALWAVHSLGAVHRDVKPENIILCGSDAILIDFDAARIHNAENDGDTQILGTAGFAAPEQYGITQSDIRTDIYALGIVINIMLTGHHPSKKLAKGHLGRIVGRCTHVNPHKRYRDVLHLMRAL